MEKIEAINQLKIVRDNLKRANVEYMSTATILFRMRSIEAIDVILKELKGDETD